jgi:7-cyano-7-deazaguanine reductase
VADDLVSVIKPRLLRVFGDFNARGGIAIHPLAVRAAEALDEVEERRCRELMDQARAYDGGR